jgi:carboxypeptidase Taq
MPSDDPYDELVDRIETIAAVEDAGGVLRWDQEVMMPAGGTPARSAQLSALSSVGHEMLVDDETAELLDALESVDLDPGQQAVVREIRRRYDRNVSVPNELVEEISRASSEAHPAWTAAKEDADFEAFAPHLERLLDLQRERAEAIDPEADPYAVLFADYEPYLGIEIAEDVLGTLRNALPPLIEEVRDADTAPPSSPLAGEHGDDDQLALVRRLLGDLGYDWDRGRLDTAPHPFSSGTPFDARVTTRVDPDEPLSALTSTIHEFGHALYTQGLPQEHYGTPLGESRDLTVHESQSRLWENHVARSRPFWEYALPIVEEELGVSTTVDAAYEAANRVRPDNVIRVEADELTYHLHVVLRFEIERDLVRGDLAVEEVPRVWNDRMERYLGVRPADDGEGCLQDIHWSHGSFGYFPTYTLGSVLAAQLDAAMRDDVGDVDARIASGDFDPIRDWLGETIHRHGQRYTTDDLIDRATGEALTADHYLEHVEEKYGDLYGI